MLHSGEPLWPMGLSFKLYDTYSIFGCSNVLDFYGMLFFSRCQTYTRLPPSCRLVTLPGQCCQIAECVQPTTTTVKTPATPTPGPVTGCYDAISNCDAYGSQSCSAPYTQWADRNCRAYCGFCRKLYLNIYTCQQFP